MRTGILVAALAAVMATGCVSTGSVMQNTANTLNAAMAQVPGGMFQGSVAPVLKPGQAAVTGDDAVFVLPATGTQIDARTRATFSRVGAYVRAQPGAQAVLYVPPSQSRNVVIEAYVQASEGAVTVRPDMRLARVTSPLLWVSAAPGDRDGVSVAVEKGFAQRVATR